MATNAVVHGTWFPDRLHAGTSLLHGRKGPSRARPRALAFMRRGTEVLEVQTTLDFPAVVLLQHADCNNLAWYIGERIN